jgi:hypothetical protein
MWVFLSLPNYSSYREGVGMTIIELCQELDCDYRIIHEVNTDGYIVNGVVVKSPANDLMFNHNLYLHLKANGGKQ